MNYQRLSFLISFDQFGEYINLQVNNSSRLKTLAGLLVTLLVAVIGFAAFILLIQDMFNRQNPDIYESTTQTLANIEGHIFKPSTFTNTVTVGDRQFNPIINTIDKTYFTVRHRFCEGNDNCWFVKANICSEYLVDLFSDQFGLNKTLARLSYCVDEEYWNTHEIKLWGTYFNTNFTRVEIYVEKCQNATTNDFICASEEEIKEKLELSYIVYGIQDYEFDRNDFEEPFHFSYQYIVQTIHFLTPQTSYIRYQATQVNSIENYFFLWPTETKYTAVQFMDSFVDLTTVDPNVLGKSIYTLTTSQNIKQRVYKNIINVFGTIGGLLSLLQVGAKVIMFPFNWIALRLYLLQILEENRQRGRSSFSKPMSLWQTMKNTKSRDIFMKESKNVLTSLEVKDIIQSVQFVRKYSESIIKLIPDMPDAFQSNHQSLSPPRKRPQQSPQPHIVRNNHFSQFSNIPSEQPISIMNRHSRDE